MSPLLPRQRGISLVEMMVGIAIGLFIVATALLALTAQLRENRSVLLDARLMQDLRTVSELMTRDLRRAGHWGDIGPGVWRVAEGELRANPYAALDTAAPDELGFFYSRDATENHVIDPNERFAYRLHNGAIEMQLGQGSWQAMTDATTMQVSLLRITPQTQHIDLGSLCTRVCAPASADCPPRQQIRSLALQINARSVSDRGVSRALSTQVRLRNDALVGACPA